MHLVLRSSAKDALHCPYLYEMNDKMDTYKCLKNSTYHITKFVALLWNQLTAMQFVQSFENPAPGHAQFIQTPIIP